MAPIHLGWPLGASRKCDHWPPSTNHRPPTTRRVSLWTGILGGSGFPPAAARRIYHPDPWRAVAFNYTQIILRSAKGGTCACLPALASGGEVRHLHLVIFIGAICSAGRAACDQSALCQVPAIRCQSGAPVWMASLAAISLIDQWVFGKGGLENPLQGGYYL